MHRRLYRLGKAVLIGEIAVVLLIIGLYRFQGFSRLVFILDGAFSWVLLVAIRQSFSLFRESLDCGEWRVVAGGAFSFLALRRELNWPCVFCEISGLNVRD